jgi:hypothetical protein
MITLTIIQSIIFIAYIAFIIIKFKGPLPSISESWYRLPGLQKQLFTLFCWALGFLMLFQTDGSTPFFFLSAAGLCFCGAAAMFKSDETTRKVHTNGAIIGIISALLAIIYERHSLIPAIIWVAISTILYILKVKNKTWWVEITAFVSIMLGLLLY